MMRTVTDNQPLDLLLVEDSRGDALLIEKTLKCAMLNAVQIIREDCLEGALRQLATKEFDLILLDRSLPDSEEFSALHSIQNFSPKVPVIYLTAYKDEQTALQAIKEGAQDYLFKDQLDAHTIKRAIQYALLRKQFEDILIMRANYDMLTGLANRMLFESRLEMALARLKRQSGALCLLFLDLNRFKQVNDKFGHCVGDKVLKEAGARLRQSLRACDTAARFGGDEFAILLEGVTDMQHGEEVARKIIRVLSAPFEVAGHRVEIGVSIGIARCSSGHVLQHEVLMKQADEAMYAAKGEKQSTYMLYDGPGKQAIRFG